ncbi:MAG: LptF/LptG family permease [Candidatus Moduliflexus flocculans]|nr:LptF/LptG family permease [Candidatus Moduliflexus flocculans]
MPRLIDRYVLREVVPPFLVGLLLVAFALLMNQVLLLAELFIDKGVPFFRALRILGLLVPSVLAFALPMAVLMGVLGGLARLSADSEIVAFQSLGVGERRLARPVAFFGLGAFLLTLPLALVLAPRANSAWVRAMTDSVIARVRLKVEPLVFNETMPGVVFFVRGVGPERHLARRLRLHGPGSGESPAGHGAVGHRPALPRRASGRPGARERFRPFLARGRAGEGHADLVRAPGGGDRRRGPVPGGLQREAGPGEGHRRARSRPRPAGSRRRRPRRAPADPGPPRRDPQEVRPGGGLPRLRAARPAVGHHDRPGRPHGRLLARPGPHPVLLRPAHRRRKGGHGRQPSGFPRHVGPGHPPGRGRGPALLRRGGRGSSVLRRRSTRRRPDSAVAGESPRKARPAARPRPFPARFPGLLDRYVSKKFLALLGLVLAALAAAAFLLTFFERLGDALERGKPVGLVARYAAFRLPELLAFLLPAAVLAAALLTLGHPGPDQRSDGLEGLRRQRLPDRPAASRPRRGRLRAGLPRPGADRAGGARPGGGGPERDPRPALPAATAIATGTGSSAGPATGSTATNISSPPPRPSAGSRSSTSTAAGGRSAAGRSRRRRPSRAIRSSRGTAGRGSTHAFRPVLRADGERPPRAFPVRRARFSSPGKSRSR